MAYSQQTFSSGQVLTAAEMNQIETNVQDHVHGRDGVGSTFDTINVNSQLNCYSRGAMLYPQRLHLVNTVTQHIQTSSGTVAEVNLGGIVESTRSYFNTGSNTLIRMIGYLPVYNIHAYIALSDFPSGANGLQWEIHQHSQSGSFGFQTPYGENITWHHLPMNQQSYNSVVSFGTPLLAADTSSGTLFSIRLRSWHTTTKSYAIGNVQVRMTVLDTRDLDV